jgi:hypothetical protein
MNWWICFQYLTASVVYWLAWFSWNVVYREFEHRSGQTKDYKLGIGYFSASHGVLKSKNKDCRLIIRTFPSWATYLPTCNCFSVLALWKVSELVHSRHHLIEMQLVLAMLWLKNSSLGIEQKSGTVNTML